MLKDKIEEILRTKYAQILLDKDIKELTTRILELVEKYVPERKLLADIVKYLGEGYSTETYAIALQVYNQAIRNMEKNIQRELVKKEKGELELCPENCKYLSPPENRPYTKFHLCGLFTERILHLNKHPRLHRCESCLYLTTKPSPAY